MENQGIILGHNGPIYSIATDEQFIYSSSADRFVTRWNPNTLQQDAFAVKLETAAYAIQKFEEVLVIGQTNGTLHGINTETKAALWEHNSFGHAIFAITRLSTQLWAIGDAEGNFFLLNDLGKRILHLPLNCGKIRVILEFQGKVLVGGQHESMLVFDLESWNELTQLSNHEGGVLSAVMFNNQLITGGADGHLQVVHSDFSIQKRIPAHYQSIYGLCVNQSQLISVSKDKSIKAWNTSLEVVARREAKQKGHTKSVNSVAIWQSIIVTASDDKSIRLWQL